MIAPFFSIIIPTYNSAKTLRKCLDSILMQSFDNWQIVLVDAISNDGTLQIAASVKNRKVKIISESDSGIYYAMNKGIKEANGAWLLFLGSDDYLFDNDVLNNVAVFIESHVVDVVYGDVYSSRFGGVYDGEFDDTKIKLKNICHQSIFFKKNVFSLIGDFDTTFRTLADWDHNFKWFLNDKLNKKYLPITISEYSDGGYSSLNSDLRFIFLKDWRYMKAQKSRLSLVNKLVFFFTQCRKLYISKRRRDLLQVISEFPDFIF